MDWILFKDIKLTVNNLQLARAIRACGKGLKRNLFSDIHFYVNLRMISKRVRSTSSSETLESFNSSSQQSSLKNVTVVQNCTLISPTLAHQFR